MKMLAFSVWDDKTCLFGAPHFASAIGQASRTFADLVNSKTDDNLIAIHPEDFALYHVGYFDTDKGQFFPTEKPNLIGRGVDYVHNEYPKEVTRA